MKLYLVVYFGVVAVSLGIIGLFLAFRRLLGYSAVCKLYLAFSLLPGLCALLAAVESQVGWFARRYNDPFFDFGLMLLSIAIALLSFFIGMILIVLAWMFDERKKLVIIGMMLSIVSLPLVELLLKVVTLLAP